MDETPKTSTEKFPCPCCGERILESRGMYDICPICDWEDDGTDRDCPSQLCGPNGLLLSEARQNFRETGSCDGR